MGAFDFGKSWFGIVFNPAGYLLQRKSPENAAKDYLAQNPTTLLIDANDTELSIKEDGRAWVDACTSKCKSDDVGKSLANCQKACQAAFDNDVNVIQQRDRITAESEAEKERIKEQLKEGVSTAVVLIIIFIFVGILYYLLT
jgi:hypothetical protein